MSNTALQVTTFDFYGDELIALRDNATGEIYASINHILRNIGFKDRQIKHIHRKWSTDIILSKGVQNFVLPSKSGNQETTCISNRKLPLALAKITITPKMKKEQPELSAKLELYQDKCADVLATVFIDNKYASDINLQPLIDAITTLSSSVSTMQQEIISIKQNQDNMQKQITKKRFSYWTTKMFPKYQALMDFFNISENKRLYKELYKEFHNMYPDIELNQIVEDFCYENKIDSCYTMDAIEHDKVVRPLFESMVNSLLEKYDLMIGSRSARQNTIFDD